MSDVRVAVTASTNGTGAPWRPVSARLALHLSLLASAYYFAALFGFGFRFQNTLIGVVWPATALLMSALLLMPRSTWWAVLAVTAVAHAAAVGNEMPFWRVLWQIVGLSVLAVTATEALRRIGTPLDFSGRRQVVVFIITSFLGPTLFAFVSPPFILSLLQRDFGYTPLAALGRSALSVATAVLLVTPVVLLWAQHGMPHLRRLSARRYAEATLLMLSLLTIFAVAFGSGPEIAHSPLLLLCVFIPLLWAAVRFGPIGASTALLCVAAVSLWGTERQLGPFVVTTSTSQILSLQLFWIVLCVPVMLLAAVIREHQQVANALQEQRRQLAHVTRAATINELSGALVHELSQPLTAILANARAGMHLLARQPGQTQELREILEDITRENKHATGVIARLRLFLKERELRFDPVAVDAVVQDALTLAHSAIAFAGVRLQTQFDSALPRVSGDQVQLTQVVLNLIVNACEAMNQIPARERQLSLRVAHTDGDHVHVVVSDRGVGLPAQAEDRVFDAFFTTKEKGLGLGLTICQSIVTAHGGQLWGENNREGGATFHVLLPGGAEGGRPPRNSYRSEISRIMA